MRLRVLLVGMFVAAVAMSGEAFAQGCGTGTATTVANPKQVCFEPSPEHDAVLDGLSVVTRYDLEVYPKGAAPTVPPIATVALGKPTPAAGAILVAFPTIPGLVNFTLYEAKVTAVGPTGIGRSIASNSFFLGGAPGAPARVILRTPVVP